MGLAQTANPNTRGGSGVLLDQCIRPESLVKKLHLQKISVDIVFFERPSQQLNVNRPVFTSVNHDPRFFWWCWRERKRPRRCTRLNVRYSNWSIGSGCRIWPSSNSFASRKAKSLALRQPKCRKSPNDRSATALRYRVIQGFFGSTANSFDLIWLTKYWASQ